MLVYSGDSLGGLENFALREADVPVPADHEVRIRIEATALGFVDGLMVQGRYQIRPPLPYIPGGEIAGTIDAVGSAVDGLSVGDRVATWQLGGGLAEWVSVDADGVDRLPSALDAAAAAAMLVDYQTSSYALRERARLRPGETILILGAAGGVGAAAVQFAKRIGARVIAAASTERKRALVADLGADLVIDSGANDLRSQLRAVLPHCTVDVVFDPVGGDTFEPMFRSIAKEGRYLVVGFAGGSIPSLPANLPLLKSAALVGVEIRHFLTAHPVQAREVRTALFEMVATGELRPPAIMPFPLESSAEALGTTTSRLKGGKVVVSPRTR